VLHGVRREPHGGLHGGDRLDHRLVRREKPHRERDGQT
jgi:hypothetical protein